MAIESMAMLVLASLGLAVHSLIRLARVHDDEWTPDPIRPGPRKML